MSTTNQNFIQKALHALGSFLGLIKSDAINVAHIANDVIDGVKSFEASAAGQFLETTLETLVPSSTGLINAVKLWLPKAFVVSGWVQNEVGKTDVQIMEDGTAYLLNLKTTDIDAYAKELHGMAAYLAKMISDNLGAGLTMPQALTLPQIVHNPELLKGN